MISGRVRAAGAILGFVLGVFPAMALAQTEPMLPVPLVPVEQNVPTDFPLEQGRTVVDRPRPEVSPLGIQAGQFFIYPHAELDEAYSDNIFATNLHAKNDFITVLTPGADVRSNFGTNALNLSAGAVITQYLSHSALSTRDPYLRADGRLDIDNIHDLHGALNFARTHEDPGSPDVTGAAVQPVHVTTYGGAAGFEQTKLRFLYSADVSAQRSEYESVPGTGGVTIPQSDRDDWAYELALRGGYEFQPGYQVFLRGAVNLRDYDHGAGNGSPIRSSYGYRADAGVRIDLTGTIFVEAFAGWFDQIYESALLGSISGPDIGVNLVWNATELTSVSFKVERNVQDVPTSVVGAALVPGYTHSTVAARVDHELLRNLLLNGQATFVNDDFQGANRTDNDYLLGAGVKYLVNRYFYLGADYTFEHRDSSGTQATNQFTRNIFMLRASTQF